MSETSTIEEFQKLEQLYQSSPARYRLKVQSMIWLAYAAIVISALVVLVFVVGGAAGFATGTIKLYLLDNFLKLAIPLLLIAGLMLRSVFVRIPKPDGLYLENELKQKVIDFVEPIRQKAGGVKIDEVILENKLNAAVSQHNQYGMFGKTTNYLYLGVPLLKLMSTDQIRAVVAHEFGHLSHEHGRLGAMVYRLNSSLGHSANAIIEKSKNGTDSWSYKILNRFYQRFNVVTFAMRRMQEYEADRVAATATDPQSIASSLCLLHALDDPLNEHWNRVWNKTREIPSIDAVSPIATISEDVQKLFNPVQAEHSVRMALEAQTGYSDTHPSLADRLKALEESPAVDAKPAEQNAFDAIFDGQSGTQTNELIEQDWRNTARNNWQENVEHFQAEKEELAKLKARSEELEIGELYQLARLEESHKGLEQAVPRYRILKDRFGDDAAVNYQWARVNIESDFEESKAAALKCIEQDIELFEDVNRLIQSGNRFHKIDAPNDILAEARQRYETYVEESNAERAEFSVDDEYFDLEMNDEARADIAAHLSDKYPEIKAVYVLTKKLTKFQGSTERLICLDIRYMHSNVNTDTSKWLNRTQNALAERYEWMRNETFLLLNDNPSFKDLAEQKPNNLLYGQKLSMARRLWNGFKTTYSIVGLIAIVGLIGWLIYQSVVG